MSDAANRLSEPVRDPVAQAAATSTEAPGTPAASVSPAAVRERALDEQPCWPLTRLVGWSLMVLLGAGIGLPLALEQPVGSAWLVALIPTVLIVLLVRILFETTTFLTGGASITSRALAAVPPALIAPALCTAIAAISGLPFSAPTAAASGTLTLLALLAAGGLRELEIRVRLGLRRVFFVGAVESRGDLAAELARRQDATLVGSSAPSRPPEQLVKEALAARATVVVLDAGAMREPGLVEAASRLNLAGLRIRDLVSYYESEFKKIPLSELSPTWFLFDIAGIHRGAASRLLRRPAESAVAAVLLTLALPALAVCVIAIRLTSRGPALYRQQRIGKDGVPFSLLKLRTMRQADDAPAQWATSQAHRITGVGRLLRRFRLDEMPQLWNVVRGDLALVGPRPEQVAIVQRLDHELPFYSARHCIRPGLTGWAQVNLGYGGSAEGTIAKLQRDLYYVKHASLRLDGLILWLTLKTVIAGRG